MPQIKVKDITGRGVPLVNVRVSEGEQDSDAAIFDVFTDFNGNSNWPLPFFPVQRYALHVNFKNIQPKYDRQSYYLLASDTDNVTIELSHAPLGRVGVYSHDFAVNGERWFMKGVTDFLLYKKFLDGEDITPLLAERAFLGANCVRVIGMVSSFSHWYPQEYGQRYYDLLPSFFDLLARYGLYCYFTVFADTQIVMPSKQDQLTHFDKVVAEMRRCTNTIGELVNEPYAHQNATDDYNAFTPPTGVAFSGGSYNDKFGNELRPLPWWENFHDFHTPRDGHNGGFKYCADQVATPHPEYRYRGKPILSGEPQKFADPAEPAATRGNSVLYDPGQARMMAGSARGTCCGIVYHTASGVYSRPFNEVEKRCGEAWFAELA